MKKIPLTQGYFAIVDDSDFDMLNRVKWHANKGHNTFYAQRSVLQENGKWKNVQMHRVILGVHDPKIQVDHINGDGLDNRRCNLRSCTRSENMQNQQIIKTIRAVARVFIGKQCRKISCSNSQKWEKDLFGPLMTLNRQQSV
jgi:hypothetical protein